MKIKLLSTILFLGISVIGFSQGTIFSENFEGGQLPAGWKSKSISTDGGFQVYNNSTFSGQSWNLAAHTNFVGVADHKSNTLNNSLDTLITSTIDLSAYTGKHLALSFEYFFRTISGGETFKVLTSANNGNTWTVAATLTNSLLDWETYSLDITSIAGKANAKIAFVYNDNGKYTYGMTLDNILIYELVDFDGKISSITPVAGTAFAYGSAGEDLLISGKISNLGYEKMQNFAIKYSDGDTTYTINFTNENLNTFSTLPFDGLYKVKTTGKHNISIWLELANDKATSNDSAATILVGVKFKPQKMVVFEEATGTWCG